MKEKNGKVGIEAVAESAAVPETFTGTELINKERNEQLVKHRRSVEYDVVSNKNYELVIGATNLCFLGDLPNDDARLARIPYGWEKETWLNMMRKPYVERLAIAGALLAAEIDRVQFTEKYLNYAQGTEE